ncbi:MAG: FliA/WhiG family RNA polymerase sigma factor [Candidatus Marinimicrobia bacterium]|nr:FliA/WhiG family RNA polymerase sigma factor [Candidatus Neomarinimicrobiota bacterium]
MSPKISEKVKKDRKDTDKLVEKYQKTKDQSIKEEIIKQYLGLVKYIIGRIKVPNNILLKRQDLQQFGIIGLMDAIERYDTSRKASFKTFAYKRIYGEILDSFRRYGAFSRRQSENINKVRNGTEQLRKALGREPTIQEICDQLEISQKEYHKIVQLTNLGYTLSLDDKINSDDDGKSLTRKDLIADDKENTPDLLLQKESVKKELKKHIKSLPERERVILALYYYEELTLGDIGQVIGVSESRISQILSATLKKLRKKLAD